MLEEAAKPLTPSLLTPGDTGYDAARKVWNAMIDRAPAAVARCRTTADVAEAVAYARAEGWPVSVKGGGHNIAGSAVADGALMIDLSPMRGVEVDASARIARVEGGALWSDLDAAGQAHGLAVPGGVVSSTGVGGLTLGGGIGWRARAHGLTIDNLISAEVVLASGDVVTASAESLPDLFWAIRGGGGNFGVVTRFTFQMHALGPEVLFGPTFFALDDARDVLTAYGAMAEGLPRACCVWANLMTAPPAPVLDERVHGQKVLTLMQFGAGDLGDCREALSALYAGVRPLGSALAPRPYTEAQSFLDETYAPGALNYWRAHNHAALSPGLIDTLLDLTPELPTPESELLISQLGGAVAEVAPDATAFPHRAAPLLSTPGVRWRDPAQSDCVIGWLKEASRRIGEHAVPGSYVNFIAEEEGGAEQAYGGNLAKLAEIKAIYDPGNLFRSNQNIAPAA